MSHFEATRLYETCTAPSGIFEFVTKWYSYLVGFTGLMKKPDKQNRGFCWFKGKVTSVSLIGDGSDFPTNSLFQRKIYASTYLLKSTAVQ